jgi:branched-chain amino acid transport system permease protein
VFLAITTRALAIVAQILIVNWDYVGGSRDIYVIRPQQSPLYGSYIQYLYSLMLALTWVSVAIARTIERSTLGLGLNAYQRTRLGLAGSFQLPKPFRSLNLVDNLRIRSSTL